MLAGIITMEDITLTYASNPDVEHTIDFTVTDQFNKDTDTVVACPQDRFFKALAIAVHNDGTPNAEDDYPDAESIMRTVRWIP